MTLNKYYSTSQQRNSFNVAFKTIFWELLHLNHSHYFFSNDMINVRLFCTIYNLRWKGVIIKILTYKRTSILINWCIISLQPLSVLRPVRNIVDTPDRWMTRSGINQIYVFIFRIFFIFLVLLEYCCCWLKLTLASLDFTVGRKWVCTKSIE